MENPLYTEHNKKHYTWILHVFFRIIRISYNFVLSSFLQIRNAVILFSAKGPTFLDKTVCAYI